MISDVPGELVQCFFCRLQMMRKEVTKRPHEWACVMCGVPVANFLLNVRRPPLCRAHARTRLQPEDIRLVVTTEFLFDLDAEPLRAEIRG
jgi:hypothetical protein